MQNMKIKFKMPALPPQVKGLVAPLKLAMEQALGRVMPYMMRLSPRERLIVAGGAVFVALFILIVGIITPLLHAGASLEKDIVSKDQQLKKIYIMSAGIKGFQSVAKTNPSTPGKQFTLFGYLEELSKQLGINDRIEYMKPISDTAEISRESVEVKIRGLYQDDLIGLLFGIESTPHPVKIKRLSLKKEEKDGVLDVTFQVIFYG